MSSRVVSSIARLGLLVATSAVVVSCKQGGPAPVVEESAPAIKLAAEDVAVVEHRTIAVGPLVSGTLEARDRAVVRAEVTGTVVAVGPELGDPVAKGALLARVETNSLDDSVHSAQAAVASAQANLDLARREVTRTEALVKGGALAARELDRARSNATTAEASLTQAKAQLAASKSQLGDATVRAPIAGVVAQRAVNQGDVVQMGALLYEIIVPSTMRLAASVSSENLSQVGKGKEVSFEVRGYPGQKFVGTIERVAPAADPATRQVPIIVEIPNPGGKLIAGLFAEGRVATEEKTTVVIPQSAVDTTGEQPTVLKVKDGVAERVTIATGLRDDRREVVEVTAGLTPGDLVILGRAARGIAAGAKVVPPPTTTTAGAAGAAPTAVPASAPAPATPATAKPAEQ